MPVSKALGYDHQSYLAPVTFAGNTTVGANGVSQKFGAFTALQLRAIRLRPSIASTSATQPLMYSVSGTSTTTTTLSAVTSAAITVQDNLLATAISMAAGDFVYLTHGTDATATVSFGIELYVTPGAALACVA
jgi:hypothetical protein